MATTMIFSSCFRVVHNFISPDPAGLVPLQSMSGLDARGLENSLACKRSANPVKSTKSYTLVHCGSEGIQQAGLELGNVSSLARA